MARRYGAECNGSEVRYLVNQWEPSRRAESPEAGWSDVVIHAGMARWSKWLRIRLKMLAVRSRIATGFGNGRGEIWGLNRLRHGFSFPPFRQHHATRPSAE
jgi:hypothetical protein